VRPRATFACGRVSDFFLLRGKLLAGFGEADDLLVAIGGHRGVEARQLGDQTLDFLAETILFSEGQIELPT
jgi:hypothetical protein